MRRQGCQDAPPSLSNPPLSCAEGLVVGRRIFKDGLRRKVDNSGQGRMWFALDWGERLKLREESKYPNN